MAAPIIVICGLRFGITMAGVTVNATGSDGGKKDEKMGEGMSMVRELLGQK